MEEKEPQNLPGCAEAFIEQVIRKMRYRRKVRQEVRRELTDHFLDALADLKDAAETDRITAEHVAAFGDPAILGRLLRRAKKRCRPLAVRVMVRTMQAAAVLLFCIVARVAYLNTGTPVIRVDYVAWMNEQVRAGRDEDLNARAYYEKAVQLSKPVPEALKQKMGELSKEPPTSEAWDAVEAFVAENAEAIDALRQGAAKPYWWNLYEAEPSNSAVPDVGSQVTSGILPSLSGYKNLAQDLALIRIPWSLHIGNLQQAADDSIVLHRFAQHLSGRGLLTEQLVGLAVEGLAHAMTYEIVGKHALSSEALEEYQRQLQEIYDDAGVIDFTLEKGFWYDFIQRTFTDDGQGSGRPMRAGLTLAAGDLQGFLKGFVAGYPDRKEVTAEIERHYRQIEAMASTTPWERKEDVAHDTVWEAKALTQKDLLDVTGPALRKTIDIAWRVRAGRAATVTVLALKRYERDEGVYPPSLDALAESGYIAKLPDDPYGDGPFQYKVAGDDFLLYSLGADMADDGGRPGTQNGEPVKWAHNGDWIFWPPME
jgi:hypothetical protein